LKPCRLLRNLLSRLRFFFLATGTTEDLSPNVMTPSSHCAATGVARDGVLIIINPAIQASNAEVLFLIINSVSSGSAFPASMKPQLPLPISSQNTNPAKQRYHVA
jgi:hypothetical protein